MLNLQLTALQTSSVLAAASVVETPCRTLPLPCLAVPFIHLALSRAPSTASALRRSLGLKILEPLFDKVDFLGVDLLDPKGLLRGVGETILKGEGGKSGWSVEEGARERTQGREAEPHRSLALEMIQNNKISAGTSHREREESYGERHLQREAT
jgi:hypothetical protein